MARIKIDDLLTEYETKKKEESKPQTVINLSEIYSRHLKTSDFLHSVQHPSGLRYIYHSFFGLGMLLKNQMNDLLNGFRTPRPISHIKDVPLKILLEFVRRGFLVEADIPEREKVINQFTDTTPKVVSRLGLKVATSCNFSCYHCIHFASEDLDGRPTKIKIMPFETAKRAIDWVANGLIKNGQTQMSIAFGGGEPLINWPTIQKILNYTKTNYKSHLDINFAINTNLALITQEMVRTFKKYHVPIIASLDGTRAGNDSVRQTKTGKPTFDLIMKGFKRLLIGGIPTKMLYVVLTSKNLDSMDDSFIQFLSQNGITSVTLDIDSVDRLDQPLHIVIHKIIELKKAAKRKNIMVTGFWARPFAKIISEEKNGGTHFCDSMAGKRIDILPDGNVYSCSYTDINLGHLDNLTKEDPFSSLTKSEAYQKMVNSRRVGQIDWCRGCEVEGLCGGGCYTTVAHSEKKNNQQILAYHCELYRQCTKELLLNRIEQKISTNDVTN